MPLSGKEMIKLLRDNGWEVDRVKGSHHYMKKKGFRPIVVPFHKELKKGTERSILKSAGLK